MLVHRFAISTAVATFLLLIVGGTVNPTGSSLACPDWPLCYGSFFPEMKGGVLFEHSHRLVATLVGAMTWLLAILIYRQRPADAVARRLGLLAAILVVVQGVLGGVTVLLRLPTAVSVGHLALSMVFFLLLVYLCFRTHPGPRRRASAAPARGLITAAAIAVYLQIVLGALVRHTGAGRACSTDIPWCLGEIWPLGAPAQLHVLHRFAGIAVALIVIAASVSIVRQAAALNRPGLRVVGIAAAVLVVLQVALGMLSVTSAIGVTEVTAHLAVGALLLATLGVAIFGAATTVTGWTATSPAASGALVTDEVPA